MIIHVAGKAMGRGYFTHADGNVITFSFEKCMAPFTKLKKVHTFFDSEILVLGICSYKLKHQLVMINVLV